MVARSNVIAAYRNGAEMNLSTTMIAAINAHVFDGDNRVAFVAATQFCGSDRLEEVSRENCEHSLVPILAFSFVQNDWAQYFLYKFCTGKTDTVVSSGPWVALSLFLTSTVLI